MLLFIKLIYICLLQLVNYYIIYKCLILFKKVLIFGKFMVGFMGYSILYFLFNNVVGEIQLFSFVVSDYSIYSKNNLFVDFRFKFKLCYFVNIIYFDQVGFYI